jgi:hypothetical protein
MLLEEIEKNPPAKGTVGFVTVAHDDNCGYWQGGACDCSPEIQITPVSVKGGTGRCSESS